ncbi:MAG: hypothetical protein BWY69_00735 [Planctomycetes bacterium ADurb.Bin401]|nr:MAG: hypothetical protein BWY69_00735 [Planctomycetes bacterium ADurb.Bin401]
MPNLKEISCSYLKAGLSVLPANVQLKFAALSGWKQYQQRLPYDSELQSWFNNGNSGISIVTGKVSGNLEMIDFDLQAQAYKKWYDLVQSQSSGLIDKLVIEKSQSGGLHVIYRVESEICGNMKLAQQKVLLPSEDEAEVCGKKYKPRKDKDGNWFIILTLIETRGEGGLFLCAPSPGYELIQGQFTEIPVLTASERDILLEAAWSLNEFIPEPTPEPRSEPVTTSTTNGLRPGDDYNSRGDFKAVLISHGWTLAQAGESERWRRPGKEIGWSASLKDRTFYVFSTNAYPFESEKAYSPFGIYTLLEHNGDYSRAAQALASQGFGKAEDISTVDISHIITNEPDDEDERKVSDPGQLPVELLNVPGFVNELRDHMLETAPHPEPVLSFFGALCEQAHLAGRKVRDDHDNRTNLYVLALAFPGCGKDHPRKVNSRLLQAAGLEGVTADGFASGEGIEDKLFLHPSSLFQTDEIDSLITSTSKGKDARIDMIMNILLKMFSASNSIYSTRLKAGKKDVGSIDQPSLTIYGTAVPENYYEALSSKMLTNGFFARMIIVESGPRAPECDAVFREIPESLIRTAKYWVNFNPGNGNLSNFHPVPICVTHTDAAKALQRDYGRLADGIYDNAQDQGDLVTMAVWSRAAEKARRLALIYACSENTVNPVITEAAVKWATCLVTYTTKRMLFMASQYVSESDFHANCQKLLRILREWQKKKKDAWMPFWMINRKLPWAQRDHEEVRTALLNQRKIEYVEETTGGPTKKLYRMIGR